MTAEKLSSVWQNANKNEKIILIALGVAFISMFLAWADAGLARINGWGFMSSVFGSAFYGKAAALSILALFLLAVPSVFMLLKKTLENKANLWIIKLICVGISLLLALIYALTNEASVGIGLVLFILCSITTGVIIYLEKKAG